MNDCTARPTGGKGAAIGACLAALVFVYPLAAAAQSGDSGSGSSGNGGGGQTPSLFLTKTVGAGEGLSDIVPKRIGELLRERLGGEGAVELLPSYAQMQAEPEGSKAGVVPRARKFYTSGIGLLEAGEYEQASNKLKKAVKILRADMAYVTEFDLYTDSLAKLARAYYQSGYDYDARQTMKEYAYLEPDASLDPEKYPSELREIYSTQIEKIEKAGPGTLTVKADVEGGTVLLDGEKKGKTPATIEDVSFGYHYVVVRHPTAGRWAKKIRFRGRGSKKTVSAKLKGKKGKGQASAKKEKKTELPAFYTEFLGTVGDGSFGTRDVEPFLKQMAQKTDADFITWTVMVKKESGYEAHPFVYRVSDQLLVRGKSVSFTLSLSNLMAGVGTLVERVVGAVEDPMKKKPVRSVQLIEKTSSETSPAVAKTDEGSETGEASGGEATATAQQTGGESKAASGGAVTPPPQQPPPEDDSSNKTLTYLGIAGGALLVGGLVTGGVLLLGNQGGKTQPKGFSASVSW